MPAIHPKQSVELMNGETLEDEQRMTKMHCDAIIDGDTTDFNKAA